MNIVVFFGSVRRERKGFAIATWIKSLLEQRGQAVFLIDPAEHEDLLVLTDKYKDTPSPSEDFSQIQQKIQEADAYLAITPEYNHSYSGALKNALDAFSGEYKRKCFGIITYSSGGFGGVRADGALRAVCSELGAPAIPSSLPISKVSQTFDEQGTLADESYNEKADKFLTELEWWALALKTKRDELFSKR